MRKRPLYRTDTPPAGQVALGADVPLVGPGGRGGGRLLPCQAEMARFAGAMRADTAAYRFTHAMKAMWLLNMPGRVADLLSNALMQAGEVGVHGISAGLDRALEPAFRRRGAPGRTRVWSGRDVVRGSAEGLREGTREAGQVLRTGRGRSPSRLADIEQGEPDFGSGLANAAFNGIFRVVSAADKPFRGMAEGRALREQARLLGMAMGVTGKDLDDYVERILPVLPDQQVRAASDVADLTVFADDTPIGRALVAGKRAFIFNEQGVESGARRVMAEQAFGFTRVPSNVAWRTLEYSPAGFAMGAANLRKAFTLATNGDPSEAARFRRAAVDQLSRAGLGTVAAFGAGWWLSQAGQVRIPFIGVTLGRDEDTDGAFSGPYPSRDAGRRGLWEVAGKQEAALKVGGQWASLRRMGPLASVMQLGALSQRAFAAESASSGAMQAAQALPSQAVGAFLATGLDQPAFSGMEQIIRMKEDFQAEGPRWWERAIAGFVPGIVTAVSNAVDGNERAAREPEGLVDALRVRLGLEEAHPSIPGLREEVPARLDAFGEPVPAPDGLSLFLDPFSMRADRGVRDHVRKEMERHGVEITRPKQGDAWDLDPETGEAVTRPETREEFHRRREMEGRALWLALARAIEDPAWDAIAAGYEAAAGIGAMKPEEARRRTLEDRRAYLAKVKDYVRSSLGELRSQARRDAAQSFAEFFGSTDPATLDEEATRNLNLEEMRAKVQGER